MVKNKNRGILRSNPLLFMPAELINLSEQLQNLQVVFQNALSSNKSIEELAELRIQIVEIQDKIIDSERSFAALRN